MSMMINIEDYFEKGFVVTTVPEDLISRFWFEIYSSNWVDDGDKTYKKIPDWYKLTENEDINESKNLKERRISAIKNKIPDSLVTLSQDLINNKVFDNLRYIRENIEFRFSHLWNGAEEIPWHMDSIDSNDVLIFIYLTEEPSWDETWGGTLSLCKNLKDKFLYETTVLPNNATMVVVNNTNPLVKHKVTSLKNLLVNRYTFSLCYKW
jgi:hypothetical protein